MTISVELIDTWGDDARVANVARVSFDKWKNEFDDKDAKLINYLAAHEHTSPFRHVGVSIRCEAPIFLARQLGKHQVGLSWNETSRRYVDSAPTFHYPDAWRSRPNGSVKQGSGDVHELNEQFKEDYKNLVYLLESEYNRLIDLGVAPEMARMILPQSMNTSWIWTGSLQAFFHVYRLRMDPHAQQEAQEFAQKLSDIIEPSFPVSWKALLCN
jgi:thymidylate synthase (FAD)